MSAEVQRTRRTALKIDVDQMYRRYGPMVQRRCRSLLGDDEEAADAMHDVFVVLVRRQERFKPTASSALLYKIATDVSLNRLRTRRRRPVEARGDDLLHRIAGMEVLGDRIEYRSVLDWLFGKTRPSTQVIAVLHYVDGMTLEETAEVMGMSVSGVRKRLRKLKKNASELREVLP